MVLVMAVPRFLMENIDIMQSQGGMGESCMCARSCFCSENKEILFTFV